MKIVGFLLSTLLSAFIGFFAFSILREFVFSKFKLNKWIILILAFIVVAIPAILKVPPTNFWVRYVLPIVYIILFLWFMEASGFFKKIQNQGTQYGNKRKKEDDVIRPKAKPNRIKNNNEKEKQ